MSFLKDENINRNKLLRALAVMPVLFYRIFLFVLDIDAA